MTAKISEKELLTYTKQTLQYLANRGKVLYIRCGSFAGNLLDKHDRKHYVDNSNPGAPDFIVFGKRYTLFLELKATGAKQRPDQVAWEKGLDRLGNGNYGYMTADSPELVNEALAFMTE